MPVPDPTLGRIQAADEDPVRKEHAVPAYLRDTYAWAYMRPMSLQLLDRPLVVSAILWGNYRRLVRGVLAELRAGQQVYQPACVYGDFSSRIVAVLGPHGRLEVADILPIQVENLRRKLCGAGNASVSLRDASDRFGKTYGVVCCFFLLHEMPPDYRRHTVDALLNAVEPGGKAVFVDYHRPHWAHPLKWIMSLIFDALEPFAKDLWCNEIASYGSRSDEFVWSKQTYFGGLYQKVVVERRRQGATTADEE